MQAALRDRLPEQLPDSQAHCLAAGLIARYCSVTEAYLASIGKELKDLFGPGDAEWRDLQSDRRGIRCARDSRDAASLQECCMKTTPAETR